MRIWLRVVIRTFDLDAIVLDSYPTLINGKRIFHDVLLICPKFLPQFTNSGSLLHSSVL